MATVHEALIAAAEACDAAAAAYDEADAAIKAATQRKADAAEKAVKLSDLQKVRHKTGLRSLALRHLGAHRENGPKTK